MSRNTVKRLANQNRDNCLFDVTSQSDRLSFLPSKVQRSVKERRRKVFSLGRRADLLLLLLLLCGYSHLSERLAQSEVTIDAP